MENTKSICKENYLVFFSILLLIFYRSPELFLHPRFWAEEATLYFKSIYENNFIAGLLFIPKYTAEYISLAANIPLTLAAHLFPIQYAPTVTTYFSLFVVLIPFVIILWGKSDLWDTTSKKILVCYLVLLAPTSTDAEIWLNTINLQVYCGIIACFILFEKLSDITRQKQWLYRILLIFCGLSGPYTTFLSLAFLLKMRIEKTKESFWHFLIVFITSGLQFSLFLVVKQMDIVSPTKMSHFSWLKAPIYIFNYHIMTPVLGLGVRLGANIKDFFQTGPWQLIPLPVFSLTACVAIALILYWLSSPRTIPTRRILLLVAFISVSVLTAYGSMHGVPYGRYSVIPGLLFLLLIMDNIQLSQKRNLKSSLLFILLGISLITGFISYNRKEYWMTYVEGAPKWDQEITQWQQNPDYLIASWPFPWHDLSWRFYLSQRQLTNDFKTKIADAGTIQLASQQKTLAEKIMHVNGLPVDFHLTFIAEATGEIENYKAAILFFDEQEKYLGQYDIAHALGTRNSAILDFFSLDRRTGPHTKMLKAFQTVRKIVFRLQSAQPVSLKISDLKVTMHNMNIF